MGWGELGSEFGGTYGGGSAMNDDAILREGHWQLQGQYAAIFKLRIPTGITVGTPMAGHQSRPTFKEYVVRGYRYAVSPAEVVKSGGILQQGDLIVAFNQEGIPADARIVGGQAETNREGYRFVFDQREFGIEYRIVGEAKVNPLGTIPGAIVLQVRKVGGV